MPRYIDKDKLIEWVKKRREGIISSTDGNLDDWERGVYSECNNFLSFINSLPEESGCECDLIAKSDNKNFEEIDEYCTLCMDINCFGCQYHDIHFRDMK